MMGEQYLMNAISIGNYRLSSIMYTRIKLCIHLFIIVVRLGIEETQLALNLLNAQKQMLVSSLFKILFHLKIKKNC